MTYFVQVLSAVHIFHVVLLLSGDQSHFMQALQYCCCCVVTMLHVGLVGSACMLLDSNDDNF